MVGDRIVCSNLPNLKYHGGTPNRLQQLAKPQVPEWDIDSLLYDSGPRGLPRVITWCVRPMFVWR